MSEERGCGTMIFLGLILGALWNIGTTLSHVVVQMKIANCLTEAAQGITCPDAQKAKP